MERKDAAKPAEPHLGSCFKIYIINLIIFVQITLRNFLITIMVFDFSIKGNNPEKKQAVNFNYNHQQNLFALLELKRLVKSVENKIEQKTNLPTN